MLGGWFTDKTHATSSRKHMVHNDENIVTTQSESSFTSPPSQQDSIRYSGSEQNKLDKSPIPSTPHDAIVNEMNEKIREIELASPSRPMSSVDPGRGDENSHSAGTRSRLADVVYDPFTGQNIGNYVPGDYPESEDDLWTHLKRIRDLQSQIAMMHSQMEGLGTTDRTLRVEQSIGDDEAMNFEEDAKEAKKEEFQKLADRFSGRKDAIDAIMNKVSLKEAIARYCTELSEPGQLEKLSHAINDFHSTREPVFRLGSRRSTLSEQEPGRGKTTLSVGPKVDKREPPLTPTRILHDDISLKETPESMARSLEPT